MRVPFVDLAGQHRPLRAEILAAWEEILDSTAFVSGKQVRAFEEEFADACGVGQCVALSNGTEALMLALRVAGVAPGDRVVVPANTFIATAEAVSHLGATPDFVDCRDDTANIDVAQAAIALGAGARAVIPVHLYGQPADVDGVLAAAGTGGAAVVEDAAQAHLATYRGRTAGALAPLASFSFYPGKNLGGPGEGGAVTTSDAGLADLVRTLRDHGQREKYVSTVVGYNARMSELVAATLRIKLRHLPEWTRARQAVAKRYRTALGSVAGIVLQAEPHETSSVHHLFVVRVANRDQVRHDLESSGIGVGLHYPVPVHLQEAYSGLGHGPGSFPHAEAWASEGLSLPMYAELADDQVDYVCEKLAASVAAHPAE